MEKVNSWLESVRSVVRQPLATTVLRGLYLALPPLARLNSTDPRDIRVEGDPPLCRSCVRIFSRPQVLDGEPTTLSTNFDRLKTSTNLGCYVCSLLYNAIWIPNSVRWMDTLTTRCLRDIIPGPEGIAYWIKNPDINEHPGCFEIYLSAVNANNLGCIWNMKLLLVPEAEVEKQMPTNISVNSTVNTAKTLATKWIERCEAEHTQCRVIGETPLWRPTRLVHVGRNDSSSTPHLCLSKNIPSNIRYVTLSHCWGTLGIVKLLSANLATFMEALPLEHLTNVFQDAIGFSRELNIEYIWIDSLCIIQDSYDDWLYESAMMGRIYKNSWCNISATGFADGHSSLYVRREPTILQPRKFNVHIRDPENKTLPNICSGKYYCMEDFWQADITEAPVNTRAWVFQERLLAPRILHFGLRQIMWECKELEACEVFPDGIPDPLKSGFKAVDLLDNKSTIESTGQQGSQSETEDEIETENQTNIDTSIASKVDNHKNFDDESDFREDESTGDKASDNEELDESEKTYLSLLDKWRVITGAYNGKGLTRYQDKFVAISGLATEMHHFTKEEYIAGFWKRNMVQQLAWYAWFEGRDFGRFHRPQVYQAPSWSWACLNVPIDDLAIMGAEPLASITEYSVSLADGNQFGQVLDAFIRIRGRLSKAAFVESDAELRKHWEKRRNPLRLRSAEPDARIEVNPFIYPDAYQAVPIGKEGMPSYPIHAALGSTEFWLLPICINPGGCPGLVLKHTGVKGQYQRIGAFAQHDSSEAEFHALMNHTPSLDADEYEESDGDGNFTFTII